MKRLLVCLLLLALASPWLSAASGPDQSHVEKIKKQVADCVGQHRRVTIETYDDRLLQGSISEAGPDAFVLSNGGRSTTLNYSDVKKIKWPSALSKQLKVAVGAIAITGALVAPLA